jgi:hypothetical protein
MKGAVYANPYFLLLSEESNGAGCDLVKTILAKIGENLL